MMLRRETGLSLLAAAALSACGGAPQPVPIQNGPPATAQVRDGVGDDVDDQELRTSLFANWDRFVDPEGHPVVYEWSIGTRPGETDVMEWRAVGGAQGAATSDIELPIGVALHVNVRAIDIGGHRSAIASSDGVVVGEPRVRVSGLGRDAPPPPPVGYLAAVDRHGVTWTFAQPVKCGRFCNGDWWAVGPVTITAIKPASLRDGARVRHGSMSNPSPTSLTQGYDSAMFGDGATGRFDPAANVALELTRDEPLTLQPGTSLVSSISHPIAGELPQLESCAVLTVLDAPPPPDSFRPPYCGTDKRCRWQASDLDLSRLARLEPVAGAPTIGELVERFERVWLDHLPGFTGRYLHPRNNMPDYGREIADLVGQGALALQLDVPNEDKRPLAIAMTQVGIDLYGVVRDGGRFRADGGSGSGRKFPVLLAGALLQDEELLRVARERKLAFAEDAQTFYVEETSPGVMNHGHGGYDASDAGLPEWGNRHADDPSLDRKAWTADAYRRCCTANAWCGFVLAARVMGLRDAWGHDALFDYVDRYMQIETRGDWMRSWSPFCERMWDRYRSGS